VSSSLVLGAAGPIAQLLCAALGLFILAVLGVIVLSWFPLQPGGAMSSVWGVLRRVTDPVLAPLRRLIPPIGGVFDLSPLIVIIVAQVVRGRLC
jgi:YggT family protein